MQTFSTLELQALPIRRFYSYLQVKIDGEHINIPLCTPVSSRITEQTPFGKAETVQFRGGKQGVSGRLICSMSPDGRFVLLQGILENRTGKDILFDKMVLLESIDVEWKRHTLVTPLLDVVPAYPLEEQTGWNLHTDAAAFFPPKGDGILIGTTGTGTAYLKINVKQDFLQVYSDMEQIVVSDGETRISEQAVLLCGDSESCVAEWAAVVGRAQNARLHRRVPDGWCSWYDRTTNIDEAHIRSVIDTVKANPNRYAPMVIQIDDGFQKCDGDWSANEKFPSGLPALAAEIAETGAMPGKWMAPLFVSNDYPERDAVAEAFRWDSESGKPIVMTENPFHPLGGNFLDPTHPTAKKFLADVMKQARDKGFSYIKIDFNGIGNFHDKKKTSYEAFRDMYALYRENLGEAIYLLACMGAPMRPMVGFCDAERIGPDSHPGGLREALNYVMRAQYMHKVWFANDPDVSYLAEMIDGRMLWNIAGGEELLRVWHSAVGLSGGLALISENISLPDAQEHSRMWEILTPAVSEKAKVYDFCRSSSIGRFGFTARRPWGDHASVLLWNDTDAETTRSVSLDTLALAAEQAAVYSFWDNAMLPVMDCTYITPMLKPDTGTLLRITPYTGEAQVVGSNLHISCGTEEIADIRTGNGYMTIRLTDAGAREGSLFLNISGKKITGLECSGCEAEVCEADAVYPELRIRGRKRGTENLLKVTFA